MKHILITIAAVLLVGCGESAPDISIYQAASDGNIEAVKQHLAAGADINARDDKRDRKTLLHLAAGKGRKGVVELLIGEGADVDAKANGAFTPLNITAGNGHKEVAELLIAEGADVNAKDDSWGFTPLHWATRQGHKEIAELLISEGADVSAKNKNGLTAMDLAIRFKEPKLADLLRKHGGKTSEELKAEGN